MRENERFFEITFENNLMLLILLFNGELDLKSIVINNMSQVNHCRFFTERLNLQTKTSLLKIRSKSQVFYYMYSKRRKISKAIGAQLLLSLLVFTSESIQKNLFNIF